MDIEKDQLIADDPAIKKNYLNRMYFLLGLHFTVISAIAFCLFMTPGVRPFVQQHAYLVPICLLGFLATLAFNKFISDSFGHSVLALVLLTLSASLAISAVALYLDTENGYLITGIVALAWFGHFLINSFNCIRLNFDASVILSPFLLVAGALVLIELIGLFAFDIFTNAPTSFALMTYILLILHKKTPDYTEDSLIGFRAVYPDIFCLRRA